jgi:hypothetical protein
MYLLDKNKLLVGDIILTRSDEKNSKFIRALTHSDFSHAILYVGQSSYIHSDLLGVHSGNLQRLLFDDPDYVSILRVNDGSFIAKAVEFARLQIGASYSKIAAANAGLKLYSKVNTKRHYCSRLVAKAYEYAGLKLVENCDVCLPQELFGSGFVSEISNCTYLASKEEMDFALSEDPIKKQAIITNCVLRDIRKVTSQNLQSLSDVTEFLINNPQFDMAITSIYEDSGYLDMWRYELRQNPWRYNIGEFMALPLSIDKLHQLAINELEMANDLLSLYKNNLEQYFYIKEIHKLKYAKQQYELYEQLVKNSIDHKITAEEAISLTKI